SELGIYIQDNRSVAQVLDAIAATVGAWWGEDRFGRYRIQQLDRPQGTPVATFKSDDLLEPPERSPTADRERSKPVWRVNVRYARNYTVQNTDVAASVDDARKALVAAEWRDAVASDPNVIVDHLLAADLTIDSLYTYESDALAEAERRLRLRKFQR